jgi:hypothetical protein
MPITEAAMPAPSRWTDPALTTGLAYAGVAVTGALGFLVVRSQLYVPQDAAATTAKLVQHEGLARLGIALDLAVVLTQSLAALGFFRLFRRVNPVAAGAITAFGLLNALSVLIATAFSATALQVAVGPAGGRSGADVQVLYQVNDAVWSAAGVFFGLWLIPMGWCAIRSRAMPDLLGRILVVGGVGYVISAFARFLMPDTTAAADLLTLPATVGELWMVGLLLLTGLRRDALAADPDPAPASADGRRFP